MREIKFRAWDGKAMEYKPGHLTNDSGVTLINDYFVEDGCTFMQFTGLHDKNGKEIYEGDVGRWMEVWGEPKYERGFVAWHSGGLWFCKDPEGKDSIGIVHDQWEVIGNIYENPELLK